MINGYNADGIFDARVHVAELVALLGPPPPEFRQRNEKICSVFWDEDGIYNALPNILFLRLGSIAD